MVRAAVAAIVTSGRGARHRHGLPQLRTINRPTAVAAADVLTCRCFALEAPSQSEVDVDF